jgi:hypothetical protein
MSAGPQMPAVTKTSNSTALSSQLLQVLVERFDQGELRTLCFHLGIDDQLLGGRGKADQARELIIYLAHRHRLAEILQVGQRMRPDIPWGDIALPCIGSFFACLHSFIQPHTSSSRRTPSPHEAI